MQHSEKRLIPRIPLGEIVQGSLALLLHGQRIPIDSLRDISQSGLSFSIHQSIDVSEKIAIAYTDTHVKVEVFGRVAWCSPILKPDGQAQAAPGSYLVGVELLSPMMLFAVLPTR